MKKIIKKLKGKKVLSLVLAAIMLATTFNIALPMLKLDASAADIEINGISQTKIVSDRTVYEEYAAEFLNGHSEPTDIVIPGLDVADDYVTQGMAYYSEKDWMLITAYHGNCESTDSNPLTPKPSMVFCIDAKTGDFVAMFSFLNVDGTANTEHGGGIAISENNIYYACGDDDRMIAYAPLSAIEGIENDDDKYREVQLIAEQDFYEIGSVTDSGKTAYTAYVCYDQGVLWTGNFYDAGSLGGLVAAQYATPANNAANSMVWGYKISGSSPEEEWANLTSGTTDCQGNPSYVVALSDNIKDVQYAVVDNGKIYISQSYGTGKGTVSASGVGGMDDYSHLTVADIDLSVPGTKEITFKTDSAGNTRTVKDAYHINWYQSFDFMPMSEGLCVINDYIFMTFESACNKYLNKAGVLVGNCQMPVDVVWKMDQHALLKEERPAECQSMYYEKVTSLAQIEDGEEYMILYESPEKDPVTQNKYLYALSANGGFHDYKLAKRYATGSEGYAGAVGHVIKDYEIEDGKLYLYDAENDDLVENRWTITGASTGNLRIKNASTYYSNYKNFYFNKDVIAMTNDASSDLNNIGIMEAGNGSFYLYYDTTPDAEGGETYLWCNDFSVDGYEDEVNDWYANKAASNVKMYSGLKETKGTFHTDGLGNGNIISQSVGENVYLRQLHIYKRVPDYYSSTVENRVYTDLDAELQADGTYKIMMETYATDPTQYQMVDERPTDFIFVVDASSSMNTADVNSNYTSQGMQSITYNNVDGSGWYIYYEGEYCALSRHKYESDPVYAPSWLGGGFIYHEHNYHCVDFRTSDNRVFHLTPDGIVDTTQQGDGPLDRPDLGQENICRLTNVGQNAGGGDTPHGTYEVFTRSGKSRLAAMKETMVNLVANIAAMDADHRMAVVQFGSNADEGWVSTGMYNTTNSTNFIQYSGDGTITNETYQNAFFSKSSSETVKQIINNITPTDDGNVDSDTYVNYGFEMANNIIDNSDATYTTTVDMTAGTNRNVCVIMVTDGIPGKGGSDTTSATEVANSTIALSKTIKSKGSYVYTIQLGNNNMDGFNMYNYLEYVSSNYLVAENMTTSGSRNTDRIDYHHDLNLNAFTTNDLLSSSILSSIKDNCENATAILGPDSVIYQQLTDAFIIPEDAQKTTELVNGWYDAIGRLTFAENGTTAPSTIESTLKNDQNYFYVKGYDYSSRYIGNKKPGEKLRVTITGVLANANSDKIENTSISDTATTAVWESEEHNVPFKYFPYKAFSIPEYTYILDYGLSLLDTDINGTLCAVSDDLTKQNPQNYNKSALGGDLAIQSGDKALLYSIDPGVTEKSGYTLINRPDGTYDWFRINVVPASNVYYEENEVKDPGSSTVGNIEWESVGTTDGIYRNLPGEGDVYGYDTHYDNTNQFSNNSHLRVDVTNKKNQTTSKKKTFQFTGTGFDLVSACGPNTGVLTLVVKDSDGNRVKSFMVDTYYKDIAVTGTTDTKLTQVPVVKWSTETYGTYTVEVAALFVSNCGSVTNRSSSTIKNNLIDTGLVMNSAKLENADSMEEILENAGLEEFIADDMELIWFDDNSVLNGGTGVAPTKKTRGLAGTNDVITLENYIDGFRVYNPLGTDASAYANYSDSEKNVTYANVIDNLAPVSEDGTVNDELFGIAYLTGLASNVTSVNFAKYQEAGPKGELYLYPGKAISFKIERSANEKVMLGLRAVKGTATAQVNNVNIEKGINSATEMYYDISNCIGDGSNVIVTVKNTGSTLLAINHIKFSGDSDKNTTVANTGTRSLTRSGDAAQVSDSVFLPVTEADLVEIEEVMGAESIPAEVKNGVVVPLVEDEEIPEDNTNTDGENGENNDSGSGDGSESTEDIFDIFSLLKALIAFIKEILFNSVGNGSLL